MTKRLLTKIARFFWSWRFLKFILWSITLIVFFYIEEDWRGARAWTATKAKWEARGESFDKNNLIPPPVPDAENLAALPLFKLTPDPNDKSGPLIDAALRKAIRYGAAQGTPAIPSGNWQKGEVPDLAKLQAKIAAEYTATLGKPTDNLDALAQFDQLYPLVAELNSAAETHPLLRLPIDYNVQPPFALSLQIVTDHIAVTRILVIHGLLALDQHQPDVALADFQTAMIFRRGISREPMLIAGLVADAITSMSLGVIYRGLATHAWSGAQLVEIEDNLRRVDALTGYQAAMRGELVLFSLPTLEFLKSHPQIANLLGTERDQPPAYDTNPIFGLWPPGWLDLNESRSADALLSSVALADPIAHRIFAGAAEKMVSDADRAAVAWGAWVPWAPWNIFSMISIRPVLNATVQFARAQVWADEARIACALERFRLAHGIYPPSLNALAPDFIDAVPHDVITGEAYHYSLRANGTFLLYSVGWNEKDDGGKAVFVLPLGADKSSPYKYGDWVWPTAR